MRHYLVFGRTEYAEPLKEQGVLSVESEQLARHQAVEEFGERWVELVLIPEAEIHWVVRAEGRDGA